MTSALMQKKTQNTNHETSEEVDKLASQLKVVLQTACRVSAAAESFGGLQIECRIKNSISGVIQHIAENLRFNFEKNKGKFDLFLRNVITSRSYFRRSTHVWVIISNFLAFSANMRSFTASGGRLGSSVRGDRSRARVPSPGTTAQPPSCHEAASTLSWKMTVLIKKQSTRERKTLNKLNKRLHIMMERTWMKWRRWWINIISHLFLVFQAFLTREMKLLNFLSLFPWMK